MSQLQLPRLTPAVKVLIIVNVAVQVIQLLSRGALTEWCGLSLGSFERWSVLGVLNLATYQVVHSYQGLGHVLLNMLVLYFFGTMVEEEIGTRRFLWLYFLSGLCGGLFWLGFSALAGLGAVPCVGASGCCYGVMIYAACRNPNARVIFIIIFVRLWWLAAILTVVALYNVIVQLRGDAISGVADAAHLGGIAYAFGYWRFGGAFAGLGERFARAAARRERAQQATRERELDRLLEKINEVGMGGLTARERRFLTRYSKERKK